MKVVITGATGFVGGEVLTQLVSDPEVTGVTALVRRPLSTDHPKVDQVLIEDFTHYPDDLLDRLADHVACLWTLGGKDSDTADPALYTRITHDFALAFAEAIAARTETFTFCYLSGAGADPTETARLPWEKLTRHIKGRTEKDLRALADHDHPGFSVHCFRPAGILPSTTNSVLTSLAAPISIRVDRLAAALVGVATRREANAPAVLSNATIKKVAGALAG